MIRDITAGLSIGKALQFHNSNVRSGKIQVSNSRGNFSPDQTSMMRVNNSINKPRGMATGSKLTPKDEALHQRKRDAEARDQRRGAQRDHDQSFFPALVQIFHVGTTLTVRIWFRGLPARELE